MGNTKTTKRPRHESAEDREKGCFCFDFFNTEAKDTGDKAGEKTKGDIRTSTAPRKVMLHVVN